MRKKYQSYRILSARTVSATGPNRGGGGGRRGYRERHRREGFWRVPFEDPLSVFGISKGGRAPCAPPPLNPLVVTILTAQENITLINPLSS